MIADYIICQNPIGPVIDNMGYLGKTNVPFFKPTIYILSLLNVYKKLKN